MFIYMFTVLEIDYFFWSYVSLDHCVTLWKCHFVKEDYKKMIMQNDFFYDERPQNSVFSMSRSQSCNQDFELILKSIWTIFTPRILTLIFKSWLFPENSDYEVMIWILIPHEFDFNVRFLPLASYYSIFFQNSSFFSHIFSPGGFVLEFFFFMEISAYQILLY